MVTAAQLLVLPTTNATAAATINTAKTILLL